MEDNRIKPVFPSPTRLKYAARYKKSAVRKKPKKHKDASIPAGEDENFIDEFV